MKVRFEAGPKDVWPAEMLFSPDKADRLHVLLAILWRRWAIVLEPETAEEQRAIAALYEERKTPN